MDGESKDWNGFDDVGSVERIVSELLWFTPHPNVNTMTLISKVYCTRQLSVAYSMIVPRNPDSVTTLDPADPAPAPQKATWSLMKSAVMARLDGCGSFGRRSVAYRDETSPPSVKIGGAAAQSPRTRDAPFPP